LGNGGGRCRIWLAQHAERIREDGIDEMPQVDEAVLEVAHFAFK
jgi:hypothetical protein